MKTQSFAVFDIDGTIIRWQLYHAICDEMAKTGIIEKATYDKVRAFRLNWKKRDNDQAFVAYEKFLITVFDDALKTIGVKSFDAIVHDVFEKYKDQVYTYTRDLLKDLKSKNYLIFAISGSPDIIVQKMASYYGFDDFAASSYERDGDKFTGDKFLAVGNKASLLDQLVQKHDLRYAGSYGVGDSEGDIEMLEKTETSIAFNPSKQLFVAAKKNGWRVVVERKNVIYKLSAKKNGYELDE